MSPIDPPAEKTPCNGLKVVGAPHGTGVVAVVGASLGDASVLSSASRASPSSSQRVSLVQPLF